MFYILKSPYLYKHNTNDVHYATSEKLTRGAKIIQDTWKKKELALIKLHLQKPFQKVR